MSYTQQQIKKHLTALELLPKSAELGTKYEILMACTTWMREAALGHARYEALRLLNPQQFAELWSRALLGRNFDELVDEIVKAKNELK